MAHQRDLLAGGSDFTAVSLSDICAHLRDWIVTTGQTMAVLREGVAEVERRPDAFNEPEHLRDFLIHSLDLFERCLSEFKRLVEELPDEVTPGHVASVAQLYRMAQEEDSRWFEYKRIHTMRGLPDEGVRVVVDRIYREGRGELQNYLDLGALSVRLEALVGTTPLVKAELEFQGSSLKFGRILRRAWAWLRRRAGG